MKTKAVRFIDKIVTYISDLAVSLFNLRASTIRKFPSYRFYLRRYSEWFSSTRSLKKEQSYRLADFLQHSLKRSSYYQSLNISSARDKKELLDEFPILEKESLRSSADISTVPRWRGVVRRTGGTTGRSLEVVFTWEDMAERLAAIDAFWGQHGFIPRKSRLIWCNGRKILNASDLRLSRFYRDDFFSKTRYLSSFNLSKETAPKYLEAIISFEPEFLVGFPSVISEIADWFEKLGVKAPVVRAVFPTAEVLTASARERIQRVFKTVVYDQYASSEGAPFIFECSFGRMHPCEYSGYFEYFNNSLEEPDSYELLVTSFSTRGTPLIRYRIGDSVVLDGMTCECGREGVSARSIQGRCNDYILTPDGRRISAGISSAAKGLLSIKEFQLIQRSLNNVDVLVVIDSKKNSEETSKLLSRLEQRVGPEISFTVHFVEDIQRDGSGKFRMVKREL